MDIQLLLVPYDSGQRGWRCGAGPEHLVRAGVPAHLQRQGHIVTAILPRLMPLWRMAPNENKISHRWRERALLRSLMLKSSGN